MGDGLARAGKSGENMIARRARVAGAGGLIGLMFRRMETDEAMIFRLGGKRDPVHTFFLRFPVDLVFTDEGMRVLEIRANLPPWRIYVPRCRPAYLMELPAGSSERAGVRVGDRLSGRIISWKKQRW